MTRNSRYVLQVEPFTTPKGVNIISTNPVDLYKSFLTMMIKGDTIWAYTDENNRICRILKLLDFDDHGCNCIEIFCKYDVPVLIRRFLFNVKTAEKAQVLLDVVKELNKFFNKYPNTLLFPFDLWGKDFASETGLDRGIAAEAHHGVLMMYIDAVINVSKNPKGFQTSLDAVCAYYGLRHRYTVDCDITASDGPDLEEVFEASEKDYYMETYIPMIR